MRRRSFFSKYLNVAAIILALCLCCAQGQGERRCEGGVLEIDAPLVSNTSLGGGACHVKRISGSCKNGRDPLVEIWFVDDGGTLLRGEDLHLAEFVYSPRQVSSAGGSCTRPPAASNFGVMDSGVNDRAYRQLKLQNITGAIWVCNNHRKAAMSYIIRARCFDIPPCPRLAPDAPECEGVPGGKCIRSGEGDSGTVSAQPYCECKPGRGGYMCEQALALVEGDQVIPITVWGGEWKFFEYLAPAGNQQLLVTLRRSRNPSAQGGGRPRLYLREVTPGGGGLPVLPSDMDSRSYDYRQSEAYIKRMKVNNSNLRSRWFIAVALDAGGGPLVLNLKVQVEAEGAPLCPARCNEPAHQGVCLSPSETSSLSGPLAFSKREDNFVCKCARGFAGPMCEANITTLTANPRGSGAHGGVLAPGRWHYYLIRIERRFDPRLDLLYIQWVVRDQTNSRNAMFFWMSGHYLRQKPVDLEEPPGHVGYYNLSDPRLGGMLYRVPGHLVRRDADMLIGIYNSEAVVSEPFVYHLEVFVPGPNRFYQPYMSIILGVTAAIVLCMLMTLCKRCLQRYRVGPFRHYNPERSGVVQLRPRGVPQAIIDTFPTFDKEHLPSVPSSTTPGMGFMRAVAAAVGRAGLAGTTPAPAPQAGGEGTDRGGGETKDEDPDELTCSVCLCEYQPGEMLRQLPCGHYFHQSCIDKWMQQHTTCPICRTVLCAGEDEEVGQDSNSSGAEGVEVRHSLASPSSSEPPRPTGPTGPS